MAKKKKQKPTVLWHPAIAAANAFEAVEDLECINLKRVGRIQDVVSTGVFSLDLILGGGFPRGRFVTMYGPEGCGKSTFLQELIVACQLAGITVVHYDVESGSDPVYMTNMGINIRHTAKVPGLTKTGKPSKKSGLAQSFPDYLYSQPDYGEQIYRHMLTTLRNIPDVPEGPPHLMFLIDSLAAMASEEVDDETGESRLSPNARMHSIFLQLIRPKLKKKGACLVCTNQTRANIGGWGNPVKEYGGAALMYYPDIKIMFTRRKLEKDKQNLQIVPITMRTTKNKTFIPFRIVEGMGLLLGRGVDKTLDTHLFLEKTGHLEVKSGKRRIVYPKKQTNFLSQKDFRELVEGPKFRQFLRKQIGKDSTFVEYLQRDDTENYFYDQDLADTKEETIDPDEIERRVTEEANEYRETRKNRRKRGKRGKGRSKKQSKKDRELEEEAA